MSSTNAVMFPLRLVYFAEVVSHADPARSTLARCLGTSFGKRTVGPSLPDLVAKNGRLGTQLPRKGWHIIYFFQGLCSLITPSPGGLRVNS